MESRLPGLTRGRHGEDVRDLQRRLGAAGHDTSGDPSGTFGRATEDAVRAFQTERGLYVDGEVGSETWGVLVESGYQLGDRLLYRRQPMLRGDDVRALQHQLNRLGFDAGREDGIFGPDTARGLVEFQRGAALPVDGICGRETIATLLRLSHMADGSVAQVREREALRSRPRRIEGRRIFVATTPGLAALGEATVRALAGARVDVVSESSGADDRTVAEAANRFDAELFIGFRARSEAAPRCAYYESAQFRSEGGYLCAQSIQIELAGVLGIDVDLCGRSYPALRETRMAAVIIELPDDALALSAFVRSSHDVARAITRGIRRAFEGDTVDQPPNPPTNSLS